MAWSTALADLRIQLNDASNQNLVKEQAVFGRTDGQNRVFFTFQDRLLAASGLQSSAAVPLRLFYDGVELAASGINVIEPVRGEFSVMLVPSGQEVRATYYFQQHLDAELNTYLMYAAGQVNADVVANVPVGLQLAALHYAMAQAHARLAVRWQQRKSEQFLLQDEPMRTEAEERVRFHQSESTRYLQSAPELRRQFYEFRMDRGRQPSFGLLKRTPWPYTPRR